MLLPPDLRSRLTPDSVNCLPAEIKREVLDLLEERRNLALRRSLIEWCRCAGYEPATHHLLLIKKLEGVARGQIQRLAVFMPPGSAKSTYGSILFAPWLLANSPMSAIIAASHTTELAEKWGRRVRNLIAEHGSALGISLSPDSQAAGRWALTSGGEYYAAGVGVGIAGFRADLAIIDDPIRSREDADSEATRERVWEWYKSDLSTRLKPGGRIILIQTRWHESDLAGRLLAEMDRGGDCWDIVSLPAQAEGGDLLGRKIGEWLWDDEYGYADFLRGQKKNQTTRNWSALFQQSPVPDTGDYFKADWIRTVDKLPDRNTLSIYGASDYAVTADGGDYTVHVVVGIDPEDRIYVLDLWREQAIVRRLDRGVLRSCLKVEAYRLGGGDRTNQGRRWSVPRAAGQRAQSLHRSPAIPHQRRQGGQSAINSWPHGDGGTLRQGRRWVVARSTIGAVAVPRRHTR
jgi:hypothetical protein